MLNNRTFGMTLFNMHDMNGVRLKGMAYMHNGEVQTRLYHAVHVSINAECSVMFI